MDKKVILLILDGWGASDIKEHNAIWQGNTTNLDRIGKKYPNIEIIASGVDVGLPAGQMGNSEVGHLNIGSGRVVYQDIMKISNAIATGEIKNNRAIIDAIRQTKDKNRKLHFLGLLSNGGVHSHIDHLVALINLAADSGLGADQIVIHPFTDGRDTPPNSGLEFLLELEEKINGKAKVGSVSGRFYPMDRDKHWNRVNRAWRALVLGEGETFQTASAAISASYDNDISDEFIKPALILDEHGRKFGLIEEGDELFMFNFRADRMREIVSALYNPNFDSFDREGIKPFSVRSMTEYDASFEIPVAFEYTAIENTLGIVLSNHNLKQLRLAETEKYAHVTFFFNGGVEVPSRDEVRELVPSPRVTTYDLQPEMSCMQVSSIVTDALNESKYNFIAVNIANGDMVGHTGVWSAALKAVETVDLAVGQIAKSALANNYHLIITADHGNIETMVENNQPLTSHTTNPVPFYLVSNDSSYRLQSTGKLADIAPTILELLGIEKPDQMSGSSLILK